jgi:hypothetical protein
MVVNENLLTSRAPTDAHRPTAQRPRPWDRWLASRAAFASVFGDGERAYGAALAHMEGPLG